MKQKPPGLPSEGVSPAIKIFVLVLTVVTVAAFGLFFAKLFGKMGGAARHAAPAPWLEAARALEARGHIELAARQYALYLNNTELDGDTRARLSLKLGRLHLSRDDCQSALPWLRHAELAATGDGERETATGLAEGCEAKLAKTPPGGPNLLE